MEIVLNNNSMRCVIKAWCDNEVTPYYEWWKTSLLDSTCKVLHKYVHLSACSILHLGNSDLLFSNNSIYLESLIYKPITLPNLLEKTFLKIMKSYQYVHKKNLYVIYWQSGKFWDKFKSQVE